MNDTGSYFGSQGVQNAFNQGKDAISAFNPDDWAAKTNAGFNTLFGGQRQDQNDFINSYKYAIAGNPSVPKLYATGNEMFNVEPLANQAATLQNAVLNTPNNVLNSAKGFNYDANQVGNQTSTILGRIQPAATAAANAAQTAQNLAQGYVNAGMQQNQMNLLPYQTQGQMLSDFWARQASGFTTTSQNQLQGLISKMQSGQALSSAEMAAYASLAQAEESYNQALGTAQIGATAGITQAQLANQFKILPAGNTLVNTFTGASQRAF